MLDVLNQNIRFFFELGLSYLAYKSINVIKPLMEQTLLRLHSNLNWSKYTHSRDEVALTLIIYIKYIQNKEVY